MDNATLKQLINVSLGKAKPDFVIKNSKLLDVFNGRFIDGDLAVFDKYIVGIIDYYECDKIIDGTGKFVVPGFIDAHVHIESSLLTPLQFERIVLPHGTTTAIWDPHEIANVKGIEGIQWALDSSKNLILDVFIMLASCVPATSPELMLETSGAQLKSRDLIPFKKHSRVLGLGEMMNFPGVLSGNDDVIDMLIAFQNMHIDGHCPSLLSKSLNAYCMSKISTDHESTDINEAREKLTKGIHILIREASNAKNSDALLPLLNEFNSSIICFATDDKKPNELMQEGSIDFIVNKALKYGIAPEIVFRASSYAVTQIYNLKDRGAIAPGYMADFCLVSPKDSSWSNGMVLHSVYKKGHLVESGMVDADIKDISHMSFSGKNINLSYCTKDSFIINAKEETTQQVHVIGVIPGQIITNHLKETLNVENGKLNSDIRHDILKIAVFERHKKTNGGHAVGFVKGFELKEGAIASSLNHDSHNVIVVGATDDAMVRAVNHLIGIDGGIVVVDCENSIYDLPLQIGGIMSNSHYHDVIENLEFISEKVKEMGCNLDSPFLQLAFLALPVIPSLKITDKGLVDVDAFKIIDVCG